MSGLTFFASGRIIMLEPGSWAFLRHPWCGSGLGNAPPILTYGYTVELWCATMEEALTRHVIRRTSVTSAHGKAAPPGVVLVDVAASSWGVLSILEDFTDYIVLQGLGVILSYTRYVAKAYLSTAT